MSQVVFFIFVLGHSNFLLTMLMPTSDRGTLDEPGLSIVSGTTGTRPREQGFL